MMHAAEPPFQKNILTYGKLDICLFSRSRLNRLVWLAAGTYLLTATFLTSLFFPAAYDLLTWTRLSLEVGAELGVAMSLRTFGVI